MTRIVATARIERPIEAVFAYVTTPANWPSWHPSSISVAGSTDHPLLVGEEVVEAFVAAGRRGETTWRVTGREAPRYWRIDTTLNRAEASIAYRLRSEGGATLFERDMSYRMPTLWWALLDRLVLRRRMERESQEAVRRLTERLA